MDYTNRYSLRGITNSNKDHTMLNIEYCETKYELKGNRYSKPHGFPIAMGFTRFGKDSLVNKDSILTILLRMLKNVIRCIN